MRIYLDNCCYNRPYDDLSYLSVNFEAQAKLLIQSWIRDGRFDLVTSEILMLEINSTPSELRKNGIINYVEENSSIHVGPNNNEKISHDAKNIMESGIKYKDACHLASALLAECDYFISTDKRLLKYQTDKIKLVNPVDFVNITEESHDN